jgi:mannosidase alpha-like ER degradation enhancer 1
LQRAVLQASRALWTRRSRINLLGTLIDVQSGQWRMGLSTVGAGSDSYYEYLLKMHVLTGEGEWLEMWNQARVYVVSFALFVLLFYCLSLVCFVSIVLFSKG